MGQLGETYEQGLSRARRRAGGVFYTPAPLVDWVVGEALAGPLARAAWRPDGSPILRVLDPAAGAGRFLHAVALRLAAEAARRGHPAESALRAIVARCLTGVERDPQAAALARAALGDGADVRVAEALTEGAVGEGEWDVVVGNPPYLRSIALKREDPELWGRLRGALHATSHGEWDLYAAFLEKALTWAAPGGEVGLVVPSRWLTAAFARPLRAWLGGQAAVRKIVHFGPRQVFAGATTYASLVFLRRGGVAHVEVARWTGGPDGELPSAGEPGWQEGRLPAASLGGAPWTLSVGAPAALLDRLRRAGPPLGEVARVAKGAGTNADPVFLVGPDVDVEDDVLVPCLRGRDVRPFAGEARLRALLPYDGDRLVAPDVLRARWPRAAAYLERHRADLERREGGRFAGSTFYRWGRPQNLVWLRDPSPKVVVPDAARRGRAALDGAGKLVIDTAYAVRPLARQTPIGLLLAVLNSPVVAAFLRATGLPLRGGYFRMKTAYLAALPVPAPGPAARAVAEQALAVRPDDPAAQAELDRAVLSLYGLSAEEIA